jgi:hypothetical protein
MSDAEHDIPPQKHDPHLHGASCNHDHTTTSSSSSGSSHVHGPDCGHDHAPSASSGGSAHEPHLPKGKSNTGWWVAGIVAAVGVGAYLINEYGKPKKEGIEAKSGDWKDSAQKSTTSDARSL